MELTIWLERSLQWHQIDKFLTLEKFCPFCWIVCASFFQKIIGNYCLLLKLWDECLKNFKTLKLGLKLLDVQRKWKHSTFSLIFALTNDITIFQNICERRRFQLLVGSVYVSRQRLAYLKGKAFTVWETIQILTYFTKHS